MPEDDARFEPSTVAEVSGGENVLLLAAAPGDETRVCGGFIAESCLRGRPPYVAILTDGAAIPDAAAQTRMAADRAAAVRASLATLGLPEDRLLFIGFFAGTVPRDGAMLAATVAGVALVSWREACNAICVPVPAEPGPDGAAALAIARMVAADQRLRLLRASRTPRLAETDGGAHLKVDVSAHGLRLERAAACLDAPSSAMDGRFEFFVEDEDFRPPTC